MKIALRFQTAIGPRTVIADTPDERTAQAIVNAHLAQEGYAEVCDPSSILTIKQILALQKKRAPKAKVANNVIKLKVNEK